MASAAIGLFVVRAVIGEEVKDSCARATPGGVTPGGVTG
jgi:hypothetical protein